MAPGLLLALAGCATSGLEPVAADAVSASLTSMPGDAQRGRAVVANRQVGLCLLCHTAPIPEERFQGDLAPSLAGAGARLNAGQLRLRLMDNRRINPETIMPPYFHSGELARVGTAWQARTVLSAQQIEDVVAYLGTLQ
jgi:sulfur-oxidizing protein SoxX